MTSVIRTSLICTRRLLNWHIIASVHASLHANTNHSNAPVFKSPANASKIATSGSTEGPEIVAHTSTVDPSATFTMPRRGSRSSTTKIRTISSNFQHWGRKLCTHGG